MKKKKGRVDKFR